MLFTLRKDNARRLEAETHAANGQNAYVYYFTEEANDPDPLSYHGYGLGFVLGNADEASAKDIPAAYRLSEIMQQMRVNFAKTGDPSYVCRCIKRILPSRILLPVNASAALGLSLMRLLFSKTGPFRDRFFVSDCPNIQYICN